MSQPTGRSAVFLQEMGVGPQWALRNPPPAALAPADDAADSGEQEFADAVAALIAAEAPPARADDARAPSLKAAAVVEAPPSQPQPQPVQAAAAVVAAAEAAPEPSEVAPAPPRETAAEDSTAWFDNAPTPPAATPARAAPVAAVVDVADAVPSARAPVSAEAIANMDWPALQAAVASCTRCELCHSRAAAVPGRGDAHAQWLALGTAPSRDDEEAVLAFAAAPGKLLDNMLGAIGAGPEEDVYLTNLVKCRPPAADDGAARLPTPDQLSACRPYLERELELAGVRVIVTLGQSAAKGLLGAAARGKVLRYDGIPTVATYHPSDLLRKPEDKAKAWADLCLAKAAHAGRA